MQGKDAFRESIERVAERRGNRSQLETDQVEAFGDRVVARGAWRIDRPRERSGGHDADPHRVHRPGWENRSYLSGARTTSKPSQPPATPDLETLEAVQRRVLWLATAIVHHANRVRENSSGVKVGGHQASSASMVSLMTALWFSELRAEDRVSVKPHASPVLHAINYLLGRLEQPYLESLRAFGGLQSYPSRTKDPDPVDYSTGSVGIGATAPIWGAMARRYLEHHRFEAPPRGRQIALLGDAELDEGAVWEAIADPWVARLGEVLWVVDLNRQSLDRVVPDIAFGRLAGMFEAAGWQVITVKYGRRLEALFERAGGEALRRRIDEMPNEEYQRLLRAEPAELRERLPGPERRARHARRRACATTSCARAFRDLGGHDIGKLIEAYREVQHDRPTVIFAYTIKGWSLPIEGHPENHSALLTERAVQPSSRRQLGTDPDDPWAPFDPGSPEGELAAAAATALAREEPEPRAAARGAGRRSAASTAARSRPSRRSAASSWTSCTTRRRWPSGWSRSARTWPARPTSAAGSTSPGSGRWASGATGSRTTRRRSCTGTRPPAAATSSSGSPRRTWSGCSASWAPPGAATASRCSRSARSTTRSWAARSSRGRSASTRAASRS